MLEMSAYNNMETVVLDQDTRLVSLDMLVKTENSIFVMLDYMYVVK